MRDRSKRFFVVGFALAALLPGALAAQEEEGPSEGWDVATSLDTPTEPLSFETDEGTWMNVDVSPDGRRIVFDLLGDLYTIPIDGGEATRITSGPAFDFHPRFSPDGDRIAFISDRGGVQNVWLVDPDGENAEQVTKESNREVNSPAWSPDGEYIFVRKHFVDTRSLGAGEVWMYHVTGGSGLQVTERNGWQKDQGEPAVSPDGEWVYYSQDVTPGQFFQYNKDPYAGIYAIRRVNLETGDTETVTGGPGGAITPRISPDGTKMAFIRRVRLETVLFLRDLETGQEWPVWAGLERDMQEAWAIHGVYSQYDWMPDGRSVVIWAQGKIWRIDTETGDAAEIPFTAQVDQTLHQAVRFPVDVAPEEFDVRMLRDVTTSPDGESVAYSALGHLYVKELDGGGARRVTSADHFEFEPAWSPDGRLIAHTTWTDVDKGRVRIVGADGSGARDVVTTPGHYVEPAFSPDGSMLVYRSAGADGIRGTTFGENTGIFVVPVDGSEEPRKVLESGSEPIFDHTGERIYFRTFDSGQSALASVDLDGTDQVVHFRSENLQQIVPSPDGRWVAFAERWRAYVAPFPRSGRPVSIGPSARAIPVGQISRDMGFYLHWSGDSRSVHWSLGDEYFTRNLEETFAFVDGGAEEPEEPEAEGVHIGFSHDFDVPTGTVAFTGARVVTMNGDQVIDGGTVIVEGNRIRAVGPDGQVDVPSGAHVVDASGKTIIPGIIDVHAHVGGESNGILAEANWVFMANLAYGVTTSHDPSNDNETVFQNAELIKAGMKMGPRLFSTGRILYGAETPFKAVTRSYDDALTHIRRMKALGAISVKSYNQRHRDARQMILKAAAEEQMMVVPEGGSLFFNNVSMVLDGHTGVEHSLPVPNVYKDVVTLFGESEVGYTPTMVVGYGGLSGEYYWYERTNVWEKDHLLTFTPRNVVDARSRRRLKAAGDDDFNHVLIARGAKEIQDAGGMALLGAHGQLQGLAAHWELWMFVQGGMSELDALRAATLDGARYLGMDADLGSIEEGKLADLVILDANPLEDIQNTEHVGMVMVNGRLYDARTLNQIGNHPGERPPLYWEIEKKGPISVP